MFSKVPTWQQPTSANMQGRNHEYKGVPHTDPMPRKTRCEPLPTIKCPDCGATMRAWRAKKRSPGYDPYSPNYGRPVLGKMLWFCGNDACKRVIDCWDGWEPPDMYRHLYKIRFFSTKLGRVVLGCAVVALLGALFGVY